MTYIYIYTRTPTRLHYPARLRARVTTLSTGVPSIPEDLSIYEGITVQHYLLKPSDWLFVIPL